MFHSLYGCDFILKVTQSYTFKSFIGAVNACTHPCGKMYWFVYLSERVIESLCQVFVCLYVRLCGSHNLLLDKHGLVLFMSPARVDIDFTFTVETEKISSSQIDGNRPQNLTSHVFVDLHVWSTSNTEGVLVEKLTTHYQFRLY